MTADEAGSSSMPSAQHTRVRALPVSKRSTCMACAGMALSAAMGPGAAAQDDVDDGAVEALELAVDEPEPRLRFEVGADVVSAYYNRGILVEDEGFIVQPYASVEYDIVADDACRITFDAGVWQSFQGAKTDANPDRSDFMQTWYDADYDLGIGVAWDQYSLRLGSSLYTSPSDAYDTYGEITLTFAIDDSEWLGPWAMNPSIMLLQEFADDDTGADGMGSGAYLEFSITPGFDITDAPLVHDDIRIDAPVVLGLSLDDYYETGTDADQTFGYLSLGVLATAPLRCVDGLSLTGGVEFLMLGDAARQFNTDEDSTEWVWRVGVVFEF